MKDIIHDYVNKKFILPLEGNDVAFVSYNQRGGIMYLDHSEVPSNYQNQGIGKVLVEKTFEQLHEEGFKAKAICSYIRAVASRSEKWKEIIL